jgi:hypothetical protein
VTGVGYLEFTAVLEAEPGIPHADLHRRFPELSGDEFQAWVLRYRLEHPATENQLRLLAAAAAAPNGQAPIPEGFPLDELAWMIRLEWIGGVTRGNGRTGAAFVRWVVAASISHLGVAILDREQRRDLQLELFDLG